MRFLKKFNESSQDSKTLYFYCFDWDDNILNMPTVIHMERLVDGDWVPVDVSTAEYAELRSDTENWRLLEGNPALAYSEFRDDGPRKGDAFIEDAKKAVSEGRFGPAWDDFVECIRNGSLFAIITARGHEAPSIKKGIEWIIDEVLTQKDREEMYNNLLKFAYLFKQDKEYDRILKGRASASPLVQLYLSNCDFVGVSAPSRGGSPANPEKAKEDALLSFMDKVNKHASSIGYKAMIGFSDDDIKNVKHVEDLMDNIHHEAFSSLISFVVKGTKYPESITKKVRKFGEGMDPMASSTVSAVSANAATGLNSADPYRTQRLDQLKFLSKLGNEALSKRKKKRF